MRLIVEGRDPSLAPLGILPHRSIDTVVRWNDVDTWSVRFRADELTTAVRGALEEGGGLRIIDMDVPGGKVITSGPYEGNDEDWTPDDRGLITLSGVSDDVHMADRVVLPVPNEPITTAGQSVTAYDVRLGAAETVLKGYVASNVSGAGALAGRGQPFFTVAPTQGRGPTVVGSGRYGSTVLELVQELALAGGLGFQTVQTDTALEFDVYEPVTRDLLVLSRQGGTLRGGKTTRQAPTATHTIILQEGEGADRFVREFTTPDAAAQSQRWLRRIERVVDRRDTDSEAAAEQTAREVLAKGTASGTIVADVQDTEQARYGQHYGLGDRVYYAPWWLPLDVPPLLDVVREARIVAGEDPTTVTVAVGPPGTTTAPPSGQYGRLRAVEADVRALRAR